MEITKIKEKYGGKMNPTERYYSNKDNCMEVLREARQYFGDKNTTEKQYNKMMDCLAFVLLYCPEELKDLTYSTIMEAEIRRLHFISIWKNN